MVIRSICDVFDITTDEWPRHVRHVRDIWEASQSSESRFQRTLIEPGAILVTGRTYTVSGEQQYVPGHIGITTSAPESPLTYIHASAPNKVAEELVKFPSSVIGVVALKA